MTGADLFDKFLGLPADQLDPRGLLGLKAGAPSDGAIVTALQERLTQVASHPEGLSPAADEVRIALHAAAARLLSGAAGSPKASETSPQAEAAPTPIEAAILLTLASMGGWNARSRERVAVLAKAYGVPVQTVVELAESLAGRPAPAPPTARTPAHRPPPRSQPLNPAQANPPAAPFEDLHPQADNNRVVRNVIIGAGIALFGAAALIVLGVTMTRPDPAASGPPSSEAAPVTTASPSPELFPTKPRAPQPALAPRPSGPARIGDWDDLLRSAAAATRLIDSDPAAAPPAFEKVYAAMAHDWVNSTGDGLVAGVDRLVEFLYRAGAHEGLAERAVEVVINAAAPVAGTGPLSPQQVSQAAWSAGVLARLSRETDLPASVRNRVQAALSAAFPGSSGPGEGTFQAGSVAALHSLAARLAALDGTTPEEVKRAHECWKAWLAGLAAVGGPDTPLFQRHVLLALDRLLLQGPDPLKSRVALESIGVLTTSLQWRTDDESRTWLLRWFDSDQVTAGDLFAVTAALAGQSSAPGVDSSMVVSGSAGASARTELRDRYAAMWGLSTGESRDALLQRWLDVAAEQESVADSDAGDTVLQAERLLQLARFNRAAMLLWMGEVAGVDDLVQTIPLARNQALDLTSRTKGALLNAGQIDLNDWVREYLGAGQNIPQRRELIARIADSLLDSPAAEVLVEEACRGTPHQVRQDARSLVLRHTRSPAVLNALLEFAPLMPITRDNAALVEEATLTSLPALRDPSWRVAVRRDLLETLLQVLAGQSPLARIDQVSEEIAALYAWPTQQEQPSGPDAPSRPEGATDEPAAETSATTAEAAIVQHRLRWQREAELLVPSAREPYNLAQLDRRRRARAQLASGRVQEFAAEQVSVCELMAYVCVAEQPGRAPRAADILADMDQQRRRCRNIFQQLAVTERARMRLWLLRFSEKRA